MADSTWADLYAEVQSGVVAGVAADTYTTEVTGVRALGKSRLLFLDLTIQVGPEAGKVAQVNLYIPEPGNRNAGFHFRKKIVGFGDLSDAFTRMDAAEDIDAALNILADALIGRRIVAEIGLRSDGDYAGSNELNSSKPADPAPVVAAPVAAVAPVAAAPVPAAAAAPVQETPPPAVAPAAAAPAAEPVPATPAEVPF